MPCASDDLEGALSDEERRSALTHTQLQSITDMLNRLGLVRLRGRGRGRVVANPNPDPDPNPNMLISPWENIAAERRETLQAMRN